MPFIGKTHPGKKLRGSLPPTRGGDPFYQTVRWRKFRNWFMSLPENQVCAICRYAAANVCDHIIPRKKGGADYDTDNCQGCCESCHARKSSTERG